MAGVNDPSATRATVAWTPPLDDGPDVIDGRKAEEESLEGAMLDSSWGSSNGHADQASRHSDVHPRRSSVHSDVRQLIATAG